MPGTSFSAGGGISASRRCLPYLPAATAIASTAFKRIDGLATVRAKRTVGALGRLPAMSNETAFLACLDLLGPDAASFLQGYVTANLDELDVRQALPMACCDIKGRVVASGWVAGVADHVRLLVHRTVADDLAAQLEKYLLFAKSKLSRSLAGLHFSATHGGDAVGLPPTGYRVVFDAEGDVGHAAFANACAQAHLVVVQKAIVGIFLPQMIGLTKAGAVSFSKGCYLGQEVVARAQHRGQVKQQLGSYRLDGAAPSPGMDVEAEDTKIGTVVAVGDGLALAAVRSAATPVVANECVLHRQ